MINELLGSFRNTIEFLHRLIADVPDESMAVQSHGAVNHPAWVIGHLIYSCQLIAGEMGVKPWLSPGWDQLFGTGSQPTDSREAYPGKDELLALLDDAQQRVCRRLAELGVEGLAAPLPDVRYRHLFPTLGHAVSHVLTSHAAVHVGQVSVWRRVVGMGPLKDTFH
jgi:hypothetical protein